MLRRCLWSLSLAVACAGQLSLAADRGAPATQDALRDKVDRLVTQLDAEKRSVRAAALQSLLALGPRVLPLLPTDSSAASPAAREAVSQIRGKLERESALASLAATRVTLRGRFALLEILNRITEQTGNRFDSTAIDAATLRREIQVDYASRTFWSAVDELTLKVGLTYASTQKVHSLSLVPADQSSSHCGSIVTESGPFRMVIASAELRPSLSESPKLLRIHWSLFAEPRLRPLFASIAAQKVFANSDSTLFKSVAPTANWEISMGEGAEPLRLGSDFEVPLTNLPKAITFRGSFTVEMAAGPERFVFDDLSSNRREVHKFGGVTVSLLGVEFPSANQKSGDAKVEVGLVYDQGGPAFESYRTWMYRNEAYLETKNGRRLNHQPIISTRRQGDGSVAVEYNFADVQGSPRDYRFVYVAPTLITPLPVEFRFQNIPLSRAAVEGIKR
jgi:hypothetical protein